MKMKKTENMVIQIITEKLLADIDWLEKIELNHNLINDLNADSLDITDLMIDFEREFNISITDQEAEKIKTVQDVVNCINQKINQ